MNEGILTEVDGRPALRFTRRLPHPVERVWRAVSAEEELAEWFVVPMDLRHQGQRFQLMEQPGTVLRYDPPRVLEWEWGDDRFSFHLEAEGGVTVLTFVHVFGDRSRGADLGSGWHVHLESLEAHLSGVPVPDADPARLLALNDSYAERFGLDPEVGRLQLAQQDGSDGDPSAG